MKNDKSKQKEAGLHEKLDLAKNLVQFVISLSYCNGKPF